MDKRVTSPGIAPIVDGRPSSRLAEQGDFARIATKAHDVVVNPFDGKALIQQPRVLWNIGRSGEAEDIDSIVEGNDYHVLGRGQILAVIEGSLGVTNVEASAIEPDQDWLRFVRR